MHLLFNASCITFLRLLFFILDHDKSSSYVKPLLDPPLPSEGPRSLLGLPAVERPGPCGHPSSTRCNRTDPQDDPWTRASRPYGLGLRRDECITKVLYGVRLRKYHFLFLCFFPLLVRRKPFSLFSFSTNITCAITGTCGSGTGDEHTTTTL